MSKVRINDLAREMEVKSRQILDVLAELGLGAGKTHSSSLEDYEADKVRAQFERGSRSAGSSNSQAARAPQGIAPKIDLSHISKPGDVLKAILAKKQEQEAEARQSHLPQRSVVAPPAPAPAQPAPKVFGAQPPAAPARPEPRRIVPLPRSAPPIIAPPPPPPAIASRPPLGAVVAKAPIGAQAAPRPAVVVAPPAVALVVKPPAAPIVREAQPPAAATVAAPVAAPVVVAPEVPAAPVEPTVASVTAAQAPDQAPVAPTPVAEPVTAPAEAIPPAVTVEAKPEEASAQLQSAHRTKGHTHTPSPTPALPARRMVMPQTGPRPVYKAPIVVPTVPAPNTGINAAGIQRGRPIFDRNRPSSGPGSYPQRTSGGYPGAPGQFPGGPRPKHPTRTTPGGYAPAGGGYGGAAGSGAPGARPGFGAGWRSAYW